MRPDSETMKMSRIANHIWQRYGGKVDKDDLIHVLKEYGVSKQKWTYFRDSLAEWGYMLYVTKTETYNMTPESARAASFSVSIKPGMHNAKEARRAVVELFARYAGVIEVGEVQNDG